MTEHSVYDANQNAPEQTTTALAANRWRQRIRRTLAQQYPITLMLGRMAEMCE